MHAGRLATVATLAAGGAFLGCLLAVRRRLAAIDRAILNLRQQIAVLQVRLDNLQDTSAVADQPADDHSPLGVHLQAEPVSNSAASLSDLFYDTIAEDSLLDSSKDTVSSLESFVYLGAHSEADLSPLFPKNLVDRLQSAYEVEKLKKAEDISDGVLQALRLAYFAYHFAFSLRSIDEERSKELHFIAKDYAMAALELDPENGYVHKWCALTVGATEPFLSLTSMSAFLSTFQEHLRRAAELLPNDWFVYYLHGRLFGEVASLGTIKKQLLATIDPQLALVTYDDALEKLQLAALYAPKTLCVLMAIARTLINAERHSEAETWLNVASSVRPFFVGDEKLVAEMQHLICAGKAEQNGQSFNVFRFYE